MHKMTPGVVTCGFVYEVNCCFNFVDILATSTTRAGCLQLNFLWINLHIYFVHLGHDCNGSSGGVDAALSLCCRNSLHSVDPAFKFQLAVHCITIDLQPNQV